MGNNTDIALSFGFFIFLRDKKFEKMWWKHILINKLKNWWIDRGNV